MKLFLKILFWFFFVLGLLIGGFWFTTKQAAKPGPEADPLQSLSADDFQAALDGIAAEHKLVGMAGKVMVNGEVIVQGATGKQNKDATKTLSADDIFHIGSIGKSMSATTIATLVEDGTLGWDETIGQHLKGLSTGDATIDPAWFDVTVEQLLTHRASAPPRADQRHD